MRVRRNRDFGLEMKRVIVSCCEDVVVVVNAADDDGGDGGPLTVPKFSFNAG